MNALLAAASLLWALAADAGAPVDGSGVALAPTAAPLPTTGEAARPDPAGAQRDWEAGLGKLRGDELGEALELLKAAHAKDPGNAAIANDLGYALMKLGARREAEAFFRRALQLDPRRSLAYVNLAELVADSADRWQRQDEILSLLKKGTALLRDDPRGRALVGLAAATFEQRVGRLGDARKRLEEIVAQKPPANLRKRALDQLSAVADQERAAVLADWPEPAATPQSAAALSAIEALLAEGRAGEALVQATALEQRLPTSAAPRFARARALEALGRYDQATRALTVLLQLRPSHAHAWRLLGTILALHGGVLESDRADQALRRALALEPSWDDLRELRRRVTERHGADVAPAVVPPRPPPTARAQALFEEAQRLAGTDDTAAARAALAQALAESPAFVEAAALFFALSGEVPAPSVRALWNDGEALVRLATEAVRGRGDPTTSELVTPWLERAVALGVSEALFQRALLRADEADSAGALADLAAYVGAEVNPPHLAEARALRRNLDKAAGASGSTVALARELLLADGPREAARALGGACKRGLAADALVELGRIAEYEGHLTEALACHRLALGAEAAGGDGGRGALERIARIAARLPPAEARALAPDLTRALALPLPIAAWAQARLAHADDRLDDALALGDRFVAQADATEPLRAEATRVLGEWRRNAGEQHAARSAVLRLMVGAGAGLLVIMLALLLTRRWRGRTVARAIARVPDLFPDVAAAVGEIRHDVLKHRTSALSLIGESVTAREEIARALTEPTTTSSAVIAIYERLRRTSAAAGVRLRPWEREPVFGPLVRALLRVEGLIGRGGNAPLIQAVDRELRDQHGPALAGLLALAPGAPLRPGAIADLIDALAAGEPTPPVQLPPADIELPLTADALHTILSNLLRNALAAVRGAPHPQIMVRVDQARDATGRLMVALLVADSAAPTVTLQEIDRRDGQRGLGLVRDLVRRWGGHLVVNPQPAPFVKAIGASFPVAPGKGAAP